MNAFQWKMSFNPDPTKLAQEVIFSIKLKKVPHASITFNYNPLTLFPIQKHLGLIRILLLMSILTIFCPKFIKQ